MTSIESSINNSIDCSINNSIDCSINNSIDCSINNSIESSINNLINNSNESSIESSINHYMNNRPINIHNLYKYMINWNIHPYGEHANPYYVVRKEAEDKGLHSINDWQEVFNISKDWYENGYFEKSKADIH